MLKYIIRLDDACPYMKKEKWDRIEYLLDKYSIKPIVGIIPNCKDKEFLTNKCINDFWEKYATKWLDKGWIIAQHGLNHMLDKNIRTEFCGKTLSNQKKILEEGNKILIEKGIKPSCFFAPAHTFDDNTIKACNELNYFKFISDGVALYPYKYKDMMFLPNIFDTPHKILPFGIYTFVFHPNNMTEEDYNNLESFIKNNKGLFDINIGEILNKYRTRKKSILDYIVLLSITVFRKIMK